MDFDLSNLITSKLIANIWTVYIKITNVFIRWRFNVVFVSGALSKESFKYGMRKNKGIWITPKKTPTKLIIK